MTAIGTSWAAGSWLDDVWADGSWAGVVVVTIDTARFYRKGKPNVYLSPPPPKTIHFHMVEDGTVKGKGKIHFIDGDSTNEK